MTKQTKQPEREWENEELRERLGVNTADVDVAVLVKGLRIETGLTQKELADKMEVKQEAIARIESASHYPTVRFLERMAKATGRKLEIKFNERTR